MEVFNHLIPIGSNEALNLLNQDHFLHCESAHNVDQLETNLEAKQVHQNDRPSSCSRLLYCICLATGATLFEMSAAAAVQVPTSLTAADSLHTAVVLDRTQQGSDRSLLPQPFLVSQLSGILQLDDSGAAVSQLQTQLTTLGYYTGPISGFFGSLTEEAVIQFQRASGLVADGIVGPSTQTAIQNALNRPATSGSPGASPGQSSVLQQGDSGSQVEALQQRLRDLGLYTGGIDGVFGPGTATAVIAFQQQNGLTADGIVGPSTEAALRRPATPTPAPVPAPTPAPAPSPSIGLPPPSPDDGLLSLGDVGPDVANLQGRLRDLGFYTGVIDGVFGRSTEVAVIAFQQARGLTADGIVGSSTSAALIAITPTPIPTPIPTPTPVPGVPLTADREGRFSVLELQQRLRRRGFYNGPLDGVLGADTRAAITAAQRAYNLSQDDILGGRFP